MQPFKKSRNLFYEDNIKTWDSYVEIILKRFNEGWFFRGQTAKGGLKSSLERACKDFDIDLSDAWGIEEQIIRDFKRKYNGDDKDFIESDTLACLALMRHHGAPTRLIDWTWSPFIAAFFALESSSQGSYSVVWCINTDWCGRGAEKICPT